MVGEEGEWGYGPCCLACASASWQGVERVRETVGCYAVAVEGNGGSFVTYCHLSGPLAFPSLY